MAENQRVLKQVFQKGLNDRLSKERRGGEGFVSLQNARLQERGSTLQVSRIEGYQQIAGDDTEFDVIYDSLVYDNDLVVYWYDSSSGEVVITFIDVGGAGTTEKRFSDTQASYGELTLLENNIYLTPYNKQLNNIGGTWYLNDFISTTPTFTLNELYEGSIQVVDGAGTDSFAEGSIDVTSTTSKAGSTATASITIDSSASGDTVVATGFYGQSVDTSISNGDTASQIASKIATDLSNNANIDADWDVTSSTNVVNIESKQIGTSWNGEGISLSLTMDTFTYTLDEPTSGGEDNILTLSFPVQPSDTVIQDTIATSDTQEDIAQKITDGINNKSGLDYSATRSGTTINVTADILGQNYNGTFGITQEGLDFTYNKTDFTGGYKATGNFFTISFSSSIPDIDTQAFSSGDSNTQLAQYVFNALDGDSDFNTYYNAELNGDTVEIRGNIANTITVTEDISANNTTVNVTDAQAQSSTLDDLTYYWYKLRFVYYDGHKTITSYPQYIKTSSPSSKALIDDIDFETDLDGNLADIEVFRKKEGQDWFLIERVTPDNTDYYYTDDGKSNLQPLDERNYVWSRNPLSQDIVRDRLVRANLEYQSKELGWSEGDVTFSTSSASDISLPKNTDIDIFAQGRFKDGTVSPHKRLGEVSTADNEVGLTTDPQTQPSNVSDLKEVAYSGKFKTREEPAISFDSIEIYNQNVPSLATKFKDDADQDNPINPHIFLGYKFFVVYEKFDNTVGYSKLGMVFDQDWSFDGTNYNGTDDSTNVEDDIWSHDLTSEPVFGSSEPEILDIEFTGNGNINIDSSTSDHKRYKLRYKRFEGTSDQDVNVFVYELAILEPLKRAISENKARVRLDSLEVSDSLSSVASNSDFIGNEVSVVGILDTSVGKQYVKNNNVSVTGKNHLYLILDSDSIYSDFNNIDLNNDGVLVDYGELFTQNEVPNLDHVYNFSLVGLEEKNFGGSTTNQTYGPNTTFDEIFVDYGLTEFSPVDEDFEEILYFGTQDEFDQDNLTTYVDYFDGYETFKENLFEYQTLQSASIFQSLIDNESLEQFQEDYPNQLVWGGSYILESNASGTRDFTFTNFKNISQDYGEIVAISYINNILLVFCERGVNRINIGEVLTQQTDSQVFVDSSTLLNNDVWILKNVPDIKPRSVTQYENMLFFCDGKDVWKFTDQLENISSGKITLDIDKEFVGAVDPKNKEYQLTNGDQTWVYSIELDLWQGPFTYKIETASAYRDNFYGVVGSDSVAFNSGNDFDGSSYDTVIESVANTLDDASVTKLFRKFYVETEGDATFSYGKEYGTWTDKTLSNYPTKNGVAHIGVNPSNKNGRQMYWKVTTQQQDFILQLVSLLLDVRKRR